jgi:DNA-binding FadR family transcriptional regulator
MADLEFHKYLVALAGNSRLLRTWQAIAIQYTVVFSYLDDAATRDSLLLAVESHQAILAALCDGDAARIGEINRIVNTQMAERCVAGYLARQGAVQVV